MNRVAVWFASFVVTFVALRQLHPSGVIFYQGVILAAVVSILYLGVQRWRTARDAGDIVRDALLLVLAAYSFVLTIPTTVDRSFTVRLIQFAGDSRAGVTPAEVEEMFCARYMGGPGGLNKRLLEQDALGTFAVHDGRYSLSRVGEALDAAFDISCVLFACQPHG